MPLNIKNYVFRFDYWKQIKKYIQDHRKKYPEDILTSDAALNTFLRSLNRNLKLEDVPGNYREHVNRRTGKIELRIPDESDTFRNFINHIYQNPPATIDRMNALRLCFALDVGSDQEANNLLRDYLCMNELSIRNLQEFIVTFALRNNLQWTDVHSLLGEYRQSLDQMPTSPSDLDSGKTIDVYEKELAGITTVEELNNYLNKPEQIHYFAKTRNTLYLALFDDIGLRYSNNTFILVESLMLSEEEIEEIKKNIKKPLDSQKLEHVRESSEYPIILYYKCLFGLKPNEEYSPEDPPEKKNYENFLSIKEITTLADVYPDTFMTYGNFTNLVRRTRSLDISVGTYILHLLVTLHSDEIDYREAKDFLKHGLDDSLLEAGFPVLNSENSFQKLVKDTYEDVFNNISLNDQSKDIRLLYLSQLRGYLKEIAAYAQKPDKNLTLQRRASEVNSSSSAFSSSEWDTED